MTPTAPATATDSTTAADLTPTVAAYLRRIGTDPGPPDLATLTRVVRAHLATIPFENLDPFTGTEPPVGTEDVVAKLVSGRRGGWCFEHNLLLHDVLRDLGFRVTPLIGRVRLGRTDDEPPTARTHRLTLVETAEGVFTADVGFGGTVPDTPLHLVQDTVQQATHAAYRYVRGPADGWVLQRRGSGDWQAQYVFDPVPAPAVDYAMGSWYLAHHPASHFRTGLVAAYTAPDHRATLDGNRYTVRRADGGTDVRELDSPAEVRGVLEDAFGIDTTGVAGLDDRLRATGIV